MQNTNAQQRAIDSVSALLQKHPADDSAKVDLMVKTLAPNKQVVCTSCPQACIIPVFVDLYSTSFSSVIGNA